MILVLASNHTVSTVSDALLRHVVPYFGTPRRLLSDRGREFVGEVWSKLTHSLGIQRLLTSPYHPEGNSINERSHMTINNMLRARLLDGVPSRTWVDKIPGIMLALNAMAHEPHGFSASMVATGREPTLPPDLEGDACASPSLEDPASYVEVVKKRLTLTHQQMTSPPAPVATNPYREGSLIFAMTTPPERTNKLAPRWKGPFVVKRVPNPYQMTYEDGLVWRTIHVNHAKPAKLPATGFLAPIPTPEPPRPALGYLPRSMQRPLPRQQPLPPPQSAAPAEGSPAPAAASPAATPPSSRRSTREAANRNSALRAVQPPPPAPGRINDNSWPEQQLRRSARLIPKACAIKSPPQPAAPQSRSKNAMARTYPLSLAFNQCLGSKEDPSSFSSVHLEDLRSGEQEYLVTVQQLIDAIPKTTDPATCFVLRGQVTLTGHQRLRHSMRAALCWANQNAGFQRATHHQPEASDPTQMKSTTVYQDPSIHSHPFTQPPISATNRNSAFTFGLERCEIPGLYKPAFPGPRQDLTAGTLRVNNSGSSLSSPSHLHPYTKPFSGRPARPYMTCPTREAGGALRERPGIVYPLLPRAQRPDTSVAIDAALPEAAAVGRQALPPAVVNIGTTS